MFVITHDILCALEQSRPLIQLATTWKCYPYDASTETPLENLSEGDHEKGLETCDMCEWADKYST